MLAVVRDPAPDAWDDLGPPRLLRCGLPVAVVVTDNVLPKDEIKVEKVDRRRKNDEE